MKLEHKRITMRNHTSLKIGGKCNTFVAPKNLIALKSALNFANQNKLPLLVIGNGTNLLLPDNEIQGIIMRIAEPYFCEFKQRNETINVQSGLSLSSLLEITSRRGLSGLEFMAGIPGTVGGAITMNAGAYGKSIGGLIDKVKVMDKKGKSYWLKNPEIGFGYRESRFKAGNEIIVSAVFKLKHASPEEIQAKTQEILEHRKARLPLDFPSAGCVFKNPSSAPAAKFIELAECKGLKIGDAEVSTKHANFIINKGNATSKDVKLLISEVQKRVYEKFKISLELELKIITTNYTNLTN